MQQKPSSFRASNARTVDSERAGKPPSFPPRAADSPAGAVPRTRRRSPQHPHSPAAHTAPRPTPPRGPHRPNHPDAACATPFPIHAEAPSLQRLAARGLHRHARAGGGARTTCTSQTKPRITSLVAAAHRPMAPCLNPRRRFPRNTRTAPRLIPPQPSRCRMRNAPPNPR